MWNVVKCLTFLISHLTTLTPHKWTLDKNKKSSPVVSQSVVSWEDKKKSEERNVIPIVRQLSSSR